MPTYSSVNKQVYYSDKASQQKKDFIRIFCDEEEGNRQASALFEGVSIFLSKNPHAFSGTELFCSEKKIYISKSYSGIIPYSVTILFQEKEDGDRWLLGIMVLDVSGKILIK